jgi:class 3 adenylate cyclase
METLPITSTPLQFALRVAHECLQHHNISIHVGDIISGIVGQTSNQFDLFGHDVNVAARLEQTCYEGHIHISEQYFDKIKDELLTDMDSCVKCCIVNPKNVGEIHTIQVPYHDVSSHSSNKVAYIS